MRENVIVAKIISMKQVEMWDEHSDTKNSEPAKHLNQFPEHRFNWKILRRAPNKVRQRKIHEAYYVMCMRPTLNNQLELTSLTLF